MERVLLSYLQWYKNLLAMQAEAPFEKYDDRLLYIIRVYNHAHEVDASVNQEIAAFLAAKERARQAEQPK